MRMRSRENRCVTDEYPFSEVYSDSVFHIFIGLAYDWVGHNLIWTVKNTGTIVVYSLSTRAHRTILSEVVSPRSIIVDSHSG